MKTVPELMREAADVFEARAQVYGDNYKMSFGKTMEALFPNGLTVVGREQWNRVGLLVQIVSKLTRYAHEFENGGHDDSLLDMSVYINMLREVDELPRDKKKREDRREAVVEAMDEIAKRELTRLGVRGKLRGVK